MYFALLFLFLTPAFALHLVLPHSTVINNNDSLYLGVVMPGQTVVVGVESKVKEGGLYGMGGYYDYITAELPNGWTSHSSMKSANPLTLYVTVGQNTAPGNYTIPITVIDDGNYEGLGSVRFYAVVSVQPHLFNVSVPTLVHVSAGDRFSFPITVFNNGDLDAVFVVNTSFNHKQKVVSVFVPAHQRRFVTFNGVSDEEGKYEVFVNVYPQCCAHDEETRLVELAVSPSLRGDVKALKRGVFLFPFIEQTVYLFILLLSPLLNA